MSSEFGCNFSPRKRQSHSGVAPPFRGSELRWLPICKGVKKQKGWITAFSGIVKGLPLNCCLQRPPTALPLVSARRRFSGAEYAGAMCGKTLVARVNRSAADAHRRNTAFSWRWAVMAGRREWRWARPKERGTVGAKSKQGYRNGVAGSDREFASEVSVAFPTPKACRGVGISISEAEGAISRPLLALSRRLPGTVEAVGRVAVTSVCRSRAPVGAWGGVEVRRVAVRTGAAASVGGKRSAACVGYGAGGEWSERHSLTGLQVGAKSEKRYR